MQLHLSLSLSGDAATMQMGKIHNFGNRNESGRRYYGIFDLILCVHNRLHYYFHFPALVMTWHVCVLLRINNSLVNESAAVAVDCFGELQWPIRMNAIDFVQALKCHMKWWWMRSMSWFHLRMTHFCVNSLTQYSCNCFDNTIMLSSFHAIGSFCIGTDIWAMRSQSL